jgi:chromosome segregation ATPase
MEITIFAVMEETLKKALKTGIETLISVTEEVRHGLTVLDKDIQELSRRVKDSNTAEKANEKLDELVEKSVAAIRDYERRATEISQKVQQHLSEVDPMARQSVEELSEKLNALAKSLSGRDPSPSQKA